MRRNASKPSGWQRNRAACGVATFQSQKMALERVWIDLQHVLPRDHCALSRVRFIDRNQIHSEMFFISFFFYSWSYRKSRKGSSWFIPSVWMIWLMSSELINYHPVQLFTLFRELHQGQTNNWPGWVLSFNLSEKQIKGQLHPEIFWKLDKIVITDIRQFSRRKKYFKNVIPKSLYRHLFFFLTSKLVIIEQHLWGYAFFYQWIWVKHWLTFMANEGKPRQRISALLLFK